jgi:hypothetical protein
MPFDNGYRDFRYRMRSLAMEGWRLTRCWRRRCGLAEHVVFSIFYNFLLMPVEKHGSSEAGKA